MGYYGDKLDAATSLAEAREIMAACESALVRATREAELTRHDVAQIAAKLKVASGVHPNAETSIVAMIGQLHAWRRAGQTVQRIALELKNHEVTIISVDEVLHAIAEPDEEASDGGPGAAEGGRLAPAAG